MRPRSFVAVVVTGLIMVGLAGFICIDPQPVQAGQDASLPNYKVLDPIRHGALTIFPVVASRTFSTSDFLTLDEGLHSGEVVVTEYGNVRGLLRRPIRPVQQRDIAEVNKLVLINNANRPLLLLAGEIVAGGKQDRVIGKDRIVPPESDPVDLGVFCVEPGRWVANSEQFGASGATYGASGSGGGVGGGTYAPPSTLMAQPSVRAKAMAEKDQNQVWAEVRKQQASLAAELQPASPSASGPENITSTTSYARVMENKDVKERVDEIARPIEQNYQSLIRQLRERKAVGVVVAVNGRIIWSDVFASSELLEKYWPKLVRSYASEAVVTRAKGGEATLQQAEAFLAAMDGRRETIESEPGIYRHAEIMGDGFRAFALTSLLPRTGFEVHLAKMAE